MTELIQLVEQLSRMFKDRIKLFEGISAEAYDNGAFCLWFDASEYSHYVIYNWGEKPSKKEVIEMFLKWLASFEERISNTKACVADLLKERIEVEDFSEAVSEITKENFSASELRAAARIKEEEK